MVPQRAKRFCKRLLLKWSSHRNKYKLEMAVGVIQGIQQAVITCSKLQSNPEHSTDYAPSQGTGCPSHEMWNRILTTRELQNHRQVLEEQIVNTCLGQIPASIIHKFFLKLPVQGLIGYGICFLFKTAVCIDGCWQNSHNSLTNCWISELGIHLVKQQRAVSWYSKQLY